jgi:hypothetical protein|tara:strand:+ start:49 stop:768 length:720 start_codon:yes stop_codon:yes gene_type:complete
MSEVATQKQAQTPSSILFRDDANKGFENVRQESLALPILKLLQNGSGEAQKRNQNYVEGAEPGMFLNTVTKKLYDGDKGINVIPCYHKTEYQEWAEFGTGSGRPENIYPADSDILSKTTKDGARDRLPNGNYILNVHQNFVLIVGDDGHAESALISMSASQGKVAKKWLSLQMSQTMSDDQGTFTPASFAFAYKLTSVLNSGKGNQWYGYNVVTAGAVKNADLYTRAKDFHNTLEANNK